MNHASEPSQYRVVPDKQYRKRLKRVMYETARLARKYNKYHAQMMKQMLMISEMNTMVLSFLNSSRSQSYQTEVLRQKIEEFPEVDELDLHIEVLKAYHFCYDEMDLDEVNAVD